MLLEFCNDFIVHTFTSDIDEKVRMDIVMSQCGIWWLVIAT